MVGEATKIGTVDPGGDRGAPHDENPLGVLDGLPRGGGGGGRAADGKRDERRYPRHSRTLATGGGESWEGMVCAGEICFLLNTSKLSVADLWGGDGNAHLL